MHNISTAGTSRQGLISRPDVVKKIRTLAAQANIFITAPGGYGKSVAATQWLLSVRGKTAKLLADNGDNNPNTFFRRLAQALGRLTGVTASTAVFTAAELMRMPFPARRARCYLLIDDLHRIENEAVLEGLARVAARLPGYIGLCLASRSAPTGALMATGRFETLTKDDLLFSPEEVQWLGAEKECSLTTKQIRSLLETTGGWAMYVSALLSGGQTEGTQSLWRYLETRVWAAWDGETKDTLLKLAIPETVTPGLCERLTGRKNGQRVLERLIRKENAFLSRVDGDRYQFHDIFREFLLSRAEKMEPGERRRLHDIAATWYFEQGDYFASAGHFIANLDHEGISRCLAMTFQAPEKESSLSVGLRLHFTLRYAGKLPEGFIAANPYLLFRCMLAAYYNGDVENHLRYWELLRRMQPRLELKHPDLASACRFMGGIDPRTPLRKYIKELTAARPGASGAARPETMSGAGTITQNLPLYHRSVRDFSEYHELKRGDLTRFRKALGVFTGRNCEIYEQCLVAGIYYEKGDLLKACRQALNARHGLRGDISSEAFVSANAILAQTLYAMGAAGEAKRVLEQTEASLREGARCLIPNVNAIRFEQAVRGGDADAAREWLAVYAVQSGHLPFYQMPLHFTTLRSYIALGDFPAAIRFGERLQELAAAYQRPLDQIESGILITAARRRAGENALETMKKAVDLAWPYDFGQLFINEGKEILPPLLALLERPAKADRPRRFVERLCAEISGYPRMEQPENPPRLSARRRKMLEYLKQGKSYGEIAAAEGIAQGTAKRHVLLLYKQLGVHTAGEAVAKAKMTGLLR